MILILLFSFLWFPKGNNICFRRLPPLLDMKNLTWVPANLTHLLDNDILIIGYDNKAN